MKIFITNRQKTIKIRKNALKAIIKEVIAHEGQSCHEVSIHFVSKNEIGELHDQFFNDPSETDCISLPMDGPEETVYRVLGEVFICPEVAIDYAKKHKTDPLKEVRLYLIHGLLHLMGYDDIQTKDRALMRSAEKKHNLNLDLLNLQI